MLHISPVAGLPQNGQGEWLIREQLSQLVTEIWRRFDADHAIAEGEIVLRIGAVVDANVMGQNVLPSFMPQAPYLPSSAPLLEL